MSVECVTLGIVDNDPLACRLLDDMFQRTQAPISVLWAVKSGTDALALCERPTTRPTVVLTDLSMPQMGGLELSRRIKDQYPQIVIIGITAFTIPSNTYSGISICIYKETPIEEIIRIIGKYTDNKALQQWDRTKPISHPQLTPTERIIMLYYSQGRTTQAISRQLSISESTVKTHQANIFKKLGVHSRSEALLRCEREGLLH